MVEGERKPETERNLEEIEVKIINLSAEKVKEIKNTLVLFGAELKFKGEIENVRVDTADDAFEKIGLNARVRKYTETKGRKKRVWFEWTIKGKRVKAEGKKKRSEKISQHFDTYESAVQDLLAYARSELHMDINVLKEKWRVRKSREQYVFSAEHGGLPGVDVVIDKLIDVTVGGEQVTGNRPTDEIPHFMEIESSSGDESDDEYIELCAETLDVDPRGELHDASERELLEHYGFLPKKVRK